VVGAAGWAATYVVGSLARGYGHAGLSGWIAGPVGIAFACAAVPVAAGISDSWLVLASASSLALALSALVSILVVARTIGAEKVRSTFLGRTDEALSREDWAAGALTALAEAGLVMPVWIAGAIGLPSNEVAALYAALRVAAAFSWMFTAVVAVITPLLAESLVRREYRRVRELIMGSAVLGGGSTLPLAAVGAVFASQLLRLIDPTFGSYGYLLIVLIAARLFDAATGAVAETLVLGDRARWELWNQVTGAVCLTTTAVLLEPAVGVLALALATAFSVCLVNLMRVVEIRWLMSNAWGPNGSAVELA
jgi:O-antigen/teichoic acid export membrane protein